MAMATPTAPSQEWMRLSQGSAAPCLFSRGPRDAFNERHRFQCEE